MASQSFSRTLLLPLLVALFSSGSALAEATAIKERLAARAQDLCQAASVWAEECVQDVVSTGHLEIARLWTFSPDEIDEASEGQVSLFYDAYYACAYATGTPLDFELCVEDVLETGDVRTAGTFRRPLIPSNENLRRRGVHHSVSQLR